VALCVRVAVSGSFFASTRSTVREGKQSSAFSFFRVPVHPFTSRKGSNPGLECDLSPLLDGWPCSKRAVPEDTAILLLH
jgi:hypothetical protein